MHVFLLNNMLIKNNYASMSWLVSIYPKSTETREQNDSVKLQSFQAKHVNTLQDRLQNESNNKQFAVLFP